MERLCPECRGELVATDAATARCSIHGGQYRILFWDARAEATPVPTVAARPTSFEVACPECRQAFAAQTEHVGQTAQCTQCNTQFTITTPAATCRRHPIVTSVTNCWTCGAPVCATCGFPRADGTQLCPDCASAPPVIATPVAALAGVMCATHRAVQAITLCQLCRTPVCGTCEFTFPGNVRVCPRCAASPPKTLSARRKKLVGWALALAGWVTLGVALLLSGALASFASNKEESELLGVVLFVFVYIPSIVGTGLAVSARDRRLTNPTVVWVGIVWNALLLAVLLLLTLVGLFH